MNRLGTASLMLSVPIALAFAPTPGIASESGYLGLVSQELTEELLEGLDLDGTEGVLVSSVKAGGPADQGGIERGDVILSVNDESIRSPRQLARHIRAHQPGEEVRIRFVRDGKESLVTVALGGKEIRKIDRRLRTPRFHKSPGVDKLRVPAHSRPARAFLGVHLQDLADENLADYFGVKENGGALVTAVEDGSPAEKAGFESGDVIVSVGDEPVGTSGELMKNIAARSPGDEVVVELIRHGKSIRKEVVLQQRSHVPSGIDKPVILRRGLDKKSIRLEKELDELRKEMFELQRRLDDLEGQS